MDVLELNRIALKKRNISLNLSTSDDIVVENARKENNLTIKVNHNGYFYYLHSRYAPYQEAEKNANKIYSSSNLFILIGFGMGYLAKALLSNLKEKDYLLIIEPSEEVFYQNIQVNDITDLLSNNQVILHIGQVNDELEGIFNMLVSLGYFNHFKVHISDNYEKLYPSDILQITNKIKHVALIHKVNVNTSLFSSEQWQENYLKNIKYAIHSVPFHQFIKAFNLPIIIVSAGPSLLDELEILKEIRNKAIIIAAGSAITTLKKYNIRPHLIISIDGGEANYKHFKKNINYSDIPLVYSPMLHYKILNEYEGPKIIVQLGSAPFFEWYNELIGIKDTGFARSGPSVANTALDIARQLTTGPICFIGQDLGFTGGYSHAEGNRNRKTLDQFKGRKLELIEANDGKELYTDYSYLSMKKWFEEFINHLELDNIYNATRRGAKIKGTAVIDFQEFVHKFCIEEIDVDESIKKLFNGYKLEKDRYSLEDVRTKLEKDILNLDKLIDYSYSARKLADEMIDVVKNVRNKNINRLIERLDEIDRKIREINDKDTLLYYIMQPVIIQIDLWDYNHVVNEKKEEYLNIAEKNYFLYDKLYETSTKVKGYLLEI